MKLRFPLILTVFMHMQRRYTDVASIVPTKSQAATRLDLDARDVQKSHDSLIRQLKGPVAKELSLALDLIRGVMHAVHEINRLWNLRRPVTIALGVGAAVGVANTASSAASPRPARRWECSSRPGLAASMLTSAWSSHSRNRCLFWVPHDHLSVDRSTGGTLSMEALPPLSPCANQRWAGYFEKKM